MNKSELVDAIAKATDMKKVDIEPVVDALFDAIVNALKNKEEVRILGFGTFSTVLTKATTARNPRTGEKIDVPAKNKIKFRPGKQATDAVEGN
ncbi:MAG: DNA-binding protein HRL53 [Holosporales bacterium]